MKLADIFAKKKAKEVTPKQEKVRTALNWVMTILCIVLIVFALVVAIFTIVRSTNGLNLTTFGDKIYMNVASDSMEPTFSTNDIIIAKRYDGDGKDLKVGQVITFNARITLNGTQYYSYNTHRIIYISRNSDGSVEFIKTRGDNRRDENGNVIPWQQSLAADGAEISRGSTGPDGTWDPSCVYIGDISSNKSATPYVVATWGAMDVDGGTFTSGKMLKGVGAFANWIQDPEQGKTRFFCVIVLPLIVLFIAYAFVLVRTLVIAKLENGKKVQGEPVRDVDSMSDEEKRRLARELLASLGGADSAGTQGDTSDGGPPERATERSQDSAPESEGAISSAEQVEEQPSSDGETDENAAPADKVED